MTITPCMKNPAHSLCSRYGVHIPQLSVPFHFKFICIGAFLIRLPLMSPCICAFRCVLIREILNAYVSEVHTATAKSPPAPAKISHYAGYPFRWGKHLQFSTNTYQQPKKQRNMYTGIELIIGSLTTTSNICRQKVYCAQGFDQSTNYRVAATAIIIVSKTRQTKVTPAILQ